jgi:diguanylate cyclase (GGDEF)-like protein
LALYGGSQGTPNDGHDNAMMGGQPILLIDPDDQEREVLVERLAMQGYKVTSFANPIDGAHAALNSPPSAVIADLWMSGISGVQLTRLLGAEAATERVAVILRGPDNPRNRFWSERAGAAAYVVKGQMRNLLLAMTKYAAPVDNDAFFTQLQGADSDIRDRIAAYLDAALFESVLSSEVRALSTCGEFEHLFDTLVQFVSQVISYRWLALAAEAPFHMGLHCHPALGAESEAEARQFLSIPADCTVLRIVDEDAASNAQCFPPLVRSILFGSTPIARIALRENDQGTPQDTRIVDIVSRELGGPLRITSLVEEAQRAATTDPLTGTMNRRAFLRALDLERVRSMRHAYPLSLLLLDVDYFKSINDKRGHASGDKVLSALARLLQAHARKVDIVARWGGEEFVVVLSGADEAGAEVAAERIRAAVQAMVIQDEDGQEVRVTISIGACRMITEEPAEQLIDRADQAMYQAKATGRNRVVVGARPRPGEAMRQTLTLSVPSEDAIRAIQGKGVV